MELHDPARETYRLEATIRSRLVMLREMMAERDDLVRDAIKIGITKQKIHEWSGLARSTINAIERGGNG